jgi:hypothetical protein
MAKATKNEGIKRKLRAMINELPAKERIKAREEIACMIMTDLYNDSIQPEYGISMSESRSTLAYLKVKIKSIMRCL